MDLDPWIARQVERDLGVGLLNFQFLKVQSRMYYYNIVA